MPDLLAADPPRTLAVLHVRRRHKAWHKAWWRQWLAELRTRGIGDFSRPGHQQATIDAGVDLVDTGAIGPDNFQCVDVARSTQTKVLLAKSILTQVGGARTCLTRLGTGIGNNANVRPQPAATVARIGGDCQPVLRVTFVT